MHSSRGHGDQGAGESERPLEDDPYHAVYVLLSETYDLCFAGGYVLPEIKKGNLRRVLFAATGALLSPTLTMQGESIPGIAHAVVIEHEGGKKTC